MKSEDIIMDFDRKRIEPENGEQQFTATRKLPDSDNNQPSTELPENAGTRLSISPRRVRFVTPTESSIRLLISESESPPRRSGFYRFCCKGNRQEEEQSPRSLSFWQRLAQCFRRVETTENDELLGVELLRDLSTSSPPRRGSLRIGNSVSGARSASEPVAMGAVSTASEDQTPVDV